MTYRLFIFSIVLLLIACQDQNKMAATGSGDDIKKVFEDYHQERLTFYNLEATYAGDNRYNDRLYNNLSEEGRKGLVDFYKSYEDRLSSYDKSTLSPTDRMSYDILAWECDVNLKQLSFPTHLTPINQFASTNLEIAQFAGGSSAQPFETVEDYDNWLKRLTDFVVWCETAQANMKKGIEEGIVLPKALTQKMIPQMAEFAKGPVEEHLFYNPIKSLEDKDFSKEDKKRLTDAYTEMINNSIIPTFKSLHEFIAGDYLAASRESTGISELPNGADYYAHQIKIFTTTEMTADEIFELGKEEVKRLLNEMRQVKKEVAFDGDLKAFFNFVRNRKELMPFTEPQQVIDNFNAIHDKMKPNLERLFDLKPKTAFEVRRTEAFREASASAEYMPGTKDGSRPGIFYIPLPDVTKYNKFDAEDLFLHEAIPGHHYQISLTQENEELPDFRRTLWYSAYGEGWALYCESLGKELGLYEDPYQYFGMLSAEMHRAIRLVVDAGMHTKGWTREEAIQYSLDNEAEPESSIIAEIERYMSWPGQALSYKVGQLKIRELRARAEKEMGDKFGIKQFHNIVLSPGCVPLKILEDEINRWIEEGKEAQTD